MSPWRVQPHIREVEILSDEETLRRLRRAPDVRIRLAFQSFGANRVDVMIERGQRGDEALGQVLVEFDDQRLTGVSTRGRSS